MGAPNSVGPGGQISFSNLPSISANNVILRASGLPTNQNGIFYYGPNQIQLAFGDGFRCVGGTTQRLPVTSSNIAGNANWFLDVNAPPTLGGQIVSGSTWNFQFWYRDPAAGQSGFNLTNAVQITFCD